MNIAYPPQSNSLAPDVSDPLVGDRRVNNRLVG